MNPISGLISLPRTSGLSKVAGPFSLLAQVDKQTGVNKWQFQTKFGLFEVYTNLHLQKGDQLHLVLQEQTNKTFIFKCLKITQKIILPSQIITTILGHFLQRGHSPNEQRIKSIQQKLNDCGLTGLQTAEKWFVNLHLKNDDQDELLPLIFPYINWEAQVEKGFTPKFPEYKKNLKLWNSKKDQTDTQWITIPLEFQFKLHQCRGLIHILWDSIRNTPRFWTLTTASFEIPLQICCINSHNIHKISVIFFKKENFNFFSKYVNIISQFLPENCLFNIEEKSTRNSLVVRSVDETI